MIKHGSWLSRNENVSAFFWKKLPLRGKYNLVSLGEDLFRPEIAGIKGSVTCYINRNVLAYILQKILKY